MNEEIREYLDELRESGEVNMLGAGPYLQREFDLSRQEAKDIVLEYMGAS